MLTLKGAAPSFELEEGPSRVVTKERWISGLLHQQLLKLRPGPVFSLMHVSAEGELGKLQTSELVSCTK